MRTRFVEQEKALTDQTKQLGDMQAALQVLPAGGSSEAVGESLPAAEREADVKVVSGLQDGFKEVLSMTQARRTGQTFGDIKAESSRVFQGIVGIAQTGLAQSFGSVTATDQSTAPPGRMDANSFALMFGIDRGLPKPTRGTLTKLLGEGWR